MDPIPVHPSPISVCLNRSVHSRFWKYGFMAIALGVAIGTPIEIAFTKHSSGRPSKALHLLNLTFIVDILSTLFVARNDRYSHVWFCSLFDVVSTVTSFITIFWPNILGFFRLLTMCRMWRLGRIYIELYRLEKKYYLPRCMRLICIAILAIHTGGGVFYGLGYREYNRSPNWIESTQNVTSFSPWGKYVTSIYWAMTTTTSVGYGDVHPVVPMEMLFVIGYMFISLGVVDYIVSGYVYRTSTTISPSFFRASMSSAIRISRFYDVPRAPTNPIVKAYEAFTSDTDANKLNLCLGILSKEDLRPSTLEVVQSAKLMLQSSENIEYLPFKGVDGFNKATSRLLFGSSSLVVQQERVATIQTGSGTGSLRLAGAFIKKWLPGSQVLLSTPTWGNHKNIFNEAQVSCCEYRYSDPNTCYLDLNGMICDIRAAPEGSLVLLHACAHNPTGIDPTPEDWEEIADVIREKNHIPLLDVAYQGFASGSLYEDVSSVGLFAKRGMELLVCQSYSKNLGIYDETVGALTIVCASPDEAKRIQSQLERIAQAMHSSPSVYGASIVTMIIENDELFKEWELELVTKYERFSRVRNYLSGQLNTRDMTTKDWTFIRWQKGMFMFVGLTRGQRNNMTKKWHVYITEEGGISLAPLTIETYAMAVFRCEHLVSAILDSHHNIR